MKRTGFTSWDGSYVADGWVEKPRHEAAVPPGWEPLRVFVKGRELRIHASSSVHLEYCPACGAGLTRYGFAAPDPEFKDWGQGEYACQLIARRQKYQCCGTPRHIRSDPLPGLDGKRHMTVRFRNSLRKHADRTNRENAKQHKLDDKTVANVKKDFVSEIFVKQRTTDRFLWVCFDEKRIYGKLHFVMSDGYTSTMIMLLDTDNPEQIREELEKFENLSFVKFVSTDGTNKYDNIIRDFFPTAIHLRDPFHLLGNLHDCREDVRLHEWRLAIGEDKDALRGRKDFWAKIDGSTYWDEKEQQRLFPHHTPLVFAANRVHLSFLNWWHSAHNPVDAANFFDDWAQKIPSEIRPFYEKFIAFVEGRRDEVFQYWATGMTNSPAEAVMRNIQAEIDKGRRYSEPGFTTTMVIKEDLKRRGALGIGDDPSPLDLDRESELSILNSQTRSAEMARRFHNRLSKKGTASLGPKPKAEIEPHIYSHDQPSSTNIAKKINKQASPVDFNATPKTTEGDCLFPEIPIPADQGPAEPMRTQCTQQICNWRAIGSTAQWGVTVPEKTLPSTSCSPLEKSEPNSTEKPK
ncbi:MAG: transposase [Terracidiphilus sp.]